MKMQEKQEELKAELEKKGGTPRFDAATFKGELLKEINSARTKPKFYVKGLMKLKKCFTQKDFIPPSR